MTTRKKAADPSPGRPQSAAKPAFTARQGQFLAYIHLYRKLHGEGPSEVDMVRFFRVSPPSVHGMLVRLEELGLVVREPRRAAIRAGGHSRGRDSEPPGSRIIRIG